MADPADELPRGFGYWTGHVVVVSCMVGAGILITSGYILKGSGNPGALLALWLIGGLAALCGALCIAELAAALPKAGGDYVFVRAAFGPGTGAVCGWATFTLGFAGPTAVVARTSAGYMLAPWPEVPTFVGQIIATVLILGLALVHCVPSVLKRQGLVGGTDVFELAPLLRACCVIVQLPSVEFAEFVRPRRFLTEAFGVIRDHDCIRDIGDRARGLGTAQVVASRSCELAGGMAQRPVDAGAFQRGHQPAQ